MVIKLIFTIGTSIRQNKEVEEGDVYKRQIQSLTLLAEVAAYYRSRKMTLYDGLQELFKKYGYFREKTVANMYPGVDGPAKIQGLMKKFREEAPTDFAGHKVMVTEDFSKAVSYTHLFWCW